MPVRYLGTLALMLPLVVSAEPTNEHPRMQRFDAEYTRTGEILDCLALSRIRSTEVLDDTHILFRLYGNTVYLNSLPRRCPRLGVVRSFGYATSLARLCDIDTIAVVDDFGQGLPGVSGRGPVLRGPHCGLGKFERVEKVSVPPEAPA